MAHKLNQIFSALADPTRRDILIMLLEDDMAVTDIAEPFEMSLAAISKHLIVLSNAGLVLQERRGRVKWCKLHNQGVTMCIGLLFLFFDNHTDNQITFQQAY